LTVARRIALGADHAGYPLKEEVKRHLAARGIEVVDLGTESTESTDYPIFAAKVARAVAERQVDQGILCCGTGVGVCIAANKVPGIRAASVSEPASARLAREHNDANILCMGARIVGVELARQIVDAWLAATFQGGRHQRRVDQIRQLEEKRS
jgi:ribose 5-phosphate isomerase B